MAHAKTTIQTEDGACDAHFFTPDPGAGQDRGPWPAVMFFMDGPGIRPALFEMGERLASNGYAVLLPNMFYRHGAADVPLEMPRDRDKMMEMVGSVSLAAAMRDMKAFLAFLDGRAEVKPGKVGTTGYCMGGAPSLTSQATYPDRVGASASFHGARLAIDTPDSPHKRAGDMKGEIYVGVSEIDPWLVDGETERLETALKAAGTKAVVEIYPGVEHGFAPPGGAAYDQAASERHWDRMLALFKRNLK
jgi:carboxymethylenebutenolidase